MVVFWIIQSTTELENMYLIHHKRLKVGALLNAHQLRVIHTFSQPVYIIFSLSWD